MFPRMTGAAVLAALMVAGCQQKPAEMDVASLSEDEKAIYAFGAVLGQQVNQQLEQLKLTPEEIEIFRTAFGDVLTDRPVAVEISKYEDRFQALAEARLAASAADAREQASVYLAEAAGREGATTTASGLVYRTLTPGSGESPEATDVVRVHYHGTLTDGTVFDSSVQRGEPAEFPLNRVIGCWTEGVQRMKVGEKAELVCPAAIAYGDQGAGATIPPGATLVFEVELLGIVEAP